MRARFRKRRDRKIGRKKGRKKENERKREREREEGERVILTYPLRTHEMKILSIAGGIPSPSVNCDAAVLYT